jgi:hypothetical protein
MRFCGCGAQSEPPSQIRDLTTGWLPACQARSLRLHGQSAGLGGLYDQEMDADDAVC